MKGLRDLEVSGEGTGTGLEDEDEDVLAVLAAGSATDFERSLPDLWNNLGSLPVAPGDDEEGERLFCLEAIEVVAAAVVDGEEWCERTSYVWSRRAWARGALRSDSASASHSSPSDPLTVPLSFLPPSSRRFCT